MAVSVETLLKRSDDRMGAVHPRIREYALELIKRAYKEGIRVQISSGFRSNEDQAYIYGQGRPNYVWNGKKYGRPGSIVSNAQPGTSVHNYGLAIDYFLVSEDGNRSLWVVNDQWRRVAAIAKGMGFEWGGDWRSFRDYPHLQWTGGLSIAQLRAGRRPTIPPLKNPLPGKPADPIEKGYLQYGDRGPSVKKMAEELAFVGYDVDVIDFLNAKMKAALMKFQEAQKLEVDGYYGPASQKALAQVVKELQAASTAGQKEEGITVADILDFKTREGKNATLRVLKRFEAKDPALSDAWRKDLEAGTFTQSQAIEVIFVAIDRGYITGKME